MPPKEVKSFSDNELLMLALIKANVKGNIKWEGVAAAVGGGKTLHSLQVKWHRIQKEYAAMGAANAAVAGGGASVADGGTGTQADEGHAMPAARKRATAGKKRKIEEVETEAEDSSE
jgi:hypothetical protein